MTVFRAGQIERVEVRQFVANEGARLHLDLIDIDGARHMFDIPWPVAQQLVRHIANLSPDKTHPVESSEK